MGWHPAPFARQIFFPCSNIISKTCFFCTLLRDIGKDVVHAGQKVEQPFGRGFPEPVDQEYGGFGGGGDIFAVKIDGIVVAGTELLGKGKTGTGAKGSGPAGGAGITLLEGTPGPLAKGVIPGDSFAISTGR